MILQKIKVVKLSTDDGQFTLPNPAAAGSEFLIRSNSWAKRTLDRGGMGMMSVVTEDGKIWIPVELVEFSNEWIDRV